MKNIKQHLATLFKCLLPIFFVTFICRIFTDKMEPLNIAMLYLLPILYTASRYGQVFTLLVSVAAVLLFDILFIPPFFNLTVHNAEYILSFAIIIFVGQFVSVLSQKAAKAKELEVGEKLYEAILGSLSHELRTPLTVVVGATSSLASNELNLSQLEKIELSKDAYNSALAMQGLVENLLTGARVEGGGFKTKITTCSIDEIVSNALQKVEKKYLKQANFVVCDEPASINSDAMLLEQAFYNLLDNAFKYGVNVKIIISLLNKVVFVKICNDGLIPNSLEVSDIGRKFFRLSNSNGINGVGLGFFLSKRIIETLNGDISSSLDENMFCVEVRIA